VSALTLGRLALCRLCLQGRIMPASRLAPFVGPGCLTFFRADAFVGLKSSLIQWSKPTRSCPRVAVSRMSYFSPPFPCHPPFKSILPRHLDIFHWLCSMAFFLHAIFGAVGCVRSAFAKTVGRTQGCFFRPPPPPPPTPPPPPPPPCRSWVPPKLLRPLRPSRSCLFSFRRTSRQNLFRPL